MSGNGTQIRIEETSDSRTVIIPQKSALNDGDEVPPKVVQSNSHNESKSNESWSSIPEKIRDKRTFRSMKNQRDVGKLTNANNSLEKVLNDVDSVSLPNDE